MFDTGEGTKAELKAQVGIGTLIVFIAMVLVAAIAAGVLIDTAGFLQSKSEETGQQSGDQVTNRLQVLNSVGLKTLEDPDSIGAVELVATKAPGANDIALEGVTVQWVDDTGTYDIVHKNVYEGNADGAFGHEATKDEDDSLTGDSPVINSADDRVRIVIDIGNPDYEYFLPPDDSTTWRVQQAYSGLSTVDPDDKVIRSSEGGLSEGATASLRFTTQSSTATTVQLVVPESLSGKTAARL